MTQTTKQQKPKPPPAAPQEPPAQKETPPPGEAEIDPVQAMRKLIHSLRPYFQQAFPKSVGLSPERFARICINVIESDDTGKLMMCTPGSLARAMLHAAEVGLEPGGALGHAYLIPYFNRDRGAYEAQFQIGVWGLVALVRRSGEVLDVWARVVFEGERFEEHGGSEPKLIHQPDPFGSDDRPRMGAYACAKLKDGTVNWVCVSEADCQRARKQNRGKSPAWDNWGDEMRKKVAIRRGSKTWPRSVEDAEAWAKALELEDGVARLRPELQEGLVRLLGERPALSVVGTGSSALDAVVAARRGAQAEVGERTITVPGERVEREDEPQAEEQDGPTHDPSAGEVDPKDEPPQRVPGEEG